jgi:hypothetical protein
LCPIGDPLRLLTFVAFDPATEYVEGEAAYDGTAELWFDSIEDKSAFFSDPDYLAIVSPDESVFADMRLTRFLVCREEQIV